MHDALRNLDLTFPAIPVGAKQTPPNLRRLLYKGGAATRADQVDELIQKGLLGDVQPDRIELLRLAHEFLNGDLAGGGSAETTRKQIVSLTAFFNWTDSSGIAMSLSTVEKAYIDWSEYLLHRLRVTKEINHITAYSEARLVGQIIDGVLGRVKPIIRAIRLKKPTGRKTPQGTKTDKQNFHETFAFGRLLQDICDGIPLSVTRGVPRCCIRLTQGGQLEYPAQCRKSSPEGGWSTYSIRKSRRKTDGSQHQRFRRDIINLRIQAELLMFIGQTGMNHFVIHNSTGGSDITGKSVYIQ